MISGEAALLALRNRVLSVVTATTGSTTLVATTTGYTRATGSFVTEGFRIGMELAGTGFSTAANNNPGVILAVAADGLSLTIEGGRTAEAS